MNLEDLERTIRAFADRSVDVDRSGGTILAEIRDNVIEASLEQSEGQLWVIEQGGDRRSAFDWLVNRVARLPLLANRILDHIPEEENFVRPSGHLLKDLNSDPDSEDAVVHDAVEASVALLDKKPAGTSSVLYLTSDAGEGKTTLINRVARKQAKLFKQKDSSWLLVPISLGGRPFMRLDDVVVADLVNRLRFQLFYYDAFIELVRLNVIVPALDGFEEVFIESSSGEAISALGSLVNDLKSSGRVLVAARKAYFEIGSFSTQAQFFDSLDGAGAVAFSRLALDRWSKEQFKEYAEKRGIQDPETLHDRVAVRLSSDHPLLTRAVLVERLVDVAESGTLEDLIERLGVDPEDYFFRFVDTIVEREAKTKWINRAGEAARPLLTVEQHHELLARVAREMWLNATDTLRNELLELIAELFASELGKAPSETRQIQERLHHHSLLSTGPAPSTQIGFDHEDFRRFYLGQAVAEEITPPARTVASFLDKGALPQRTAEAAVDRLVREGIELDRVAENIIDLGGKVPSTSFAKDNAGNIALSIMERLDEPVHALHKLSFPVDSLQGRRLRKAQFVDCHFRPTSLAAAKLWECSFKGCQFDRLEVAESSTIEAVRFNECDVSSLALEAGRRELFDPLEIEQALADVGFVVDDHQVEEQLELDEPDVARDIAEHALRAFMRSTHITENVFRQRMGTRTPQFFDDVLPRLLRKGVIEEVEYHGQGQQRRFKLNVPMRNIEGAIRKGRSFDQFVVLLKGET